MVRSGFQDVHLPFIVYRATIFRMTYFLQNLHMFDFTFGLINYFSPNLSKHCSISVLNRSSFRFRYIYILGAQTNIKHRRCSLSPVAMKSISCDLLLHRNICNDENKPKSRGNDFFLSLWRNHSYNLQEDQSRMNCVTLLSAVG